MNNFSLFVARRRAVNRERAVLEACKIISAAVRGRGSLPYCMNRIGVIADQIEAAMSSSHVGDMESLISIDNAITPDRKHRG